MTRPHHLALLLLPLLTRSIPAAAQSPTAGEGPTWIEQTAHWGRWPVLAGAGTLIGLAAFRSHDAREALGGLNAYCGLDVTRCVLVEDPETGGEYYADPNAEALYREYARLSRQAQGFLIGGQVSLLAAGGLFLIDLLHRDSDFGNIPYTPLELYSTPNKLGLALRF